MKHVARYMTLGAPTGAAGCKHNPRRMGPPPERETVVIIDEGIPLGALLFEEFTLDVFKNDKGQFLARDTHGGIRIFDIDLVEILDNHFECGIRFCREEDVEKATDKLAGGRIKRHYGDRVPMIPVMDVVEKKPKARRTRKKK